jgi:hypothetical protein
MSILILCISSLAALTFTFLTEVFQKTLQEYSLDVLLQMRCLGRTRYHSRTSWYPVVETCPAKSKHEVALQSMLLNLYTRSPGIRQYHLSRGTS